MHKARMSGNLVIIEGITSHNQGRRFSAYLRENIDWTIALRYDSIFEEMINWRGRISQIMSGIAELTPDALLPHVENWFNRIIAQGVMWTKKMGGIPEWITFELPCRVWVEEKEDEVMKMLEELYDIAVPRLPENVGTVPQMYCRVVIGGWFVLNKAVVERITHKWSDVFVNGVPAWCDVDISVSSVYAVDRDAIKIAGKRIEVVTR